MPNFLGNIGGTEIFFLLVIVLVIFGPKRLPGLGKAMGKSIREFKDSLKGIGGDDDEEESRPAASIARSEPRPASVAASTTTDADEQAKPN